MVGGSTGSATDSSIVSERESAEFEYVSRVVSEGLCKRFHVHVLYVLS